MDLDLKGKRAFVSGASSGIGRGIAIELAKEGCDVAVHGRDKARTEQTAHDVEALGVKAVVALGDLAVEGDCEAVAKATLAGLGSVDIIVNNAGIALRKDNPVWSDIPFGTYIDSFQVNFMSTLRMTSHFLPCIKANGWGRIVNISTGASLNAGLLSDYGCAKASLNKLTADMSREVGRYGATANGVMPGIIMTPAIEEYLGVLAKRLNWEGDVPAWEKRYLSELAPQAVQRMGQPEDIAKMTAFLSSDVAGYITGVTIRVGGGSGNAVYF
jgi:NAD(P)-dependent dehydrogenase (short-subunit alcohol dehydrogenase family)